MAKRVQTRTALDVQLFEYVRAHNGVTEGAVSALARTAGFDPDAALRAAKNAHKAKRFAFSTNGNGIKVFTISQRSR